MSFFFPPWLPSSLGKSVSNTMLSDKLPNDRAIKEIQELTQKTLSGQEMESSPESSRARTISLISSPIENASERVLNLFEKLEKRCLEYKEARLHSLESIRKTELVILLADLLITPEGRINTSLIPIILDHIPSHYLWEKHLKRFLTQLFNEGELLNAIENLQPPPTIHPISEKIIRLTLKLAPEAPIEKRDIQKILLGNLLTLYRQQGAGSCFSASLALAIHSNHPTKTLNDLYSLIAKGVITRNLNGIQKDYPALFRNSDVKLIQTIILNKDGSYKIGERSFGPIWNAPEMILACEHLGIKDIPKAFEPLLETIEEKILITPEKLFMKLAKAHSSKPHDAFQILSLSFSAQGYPYFLGAWENALAGMAETEEGSILRNKIIHVIQSAFSSLFPKMISDQKSLLLKLGEILQKRIRLQYDPLITNPTSSFSPSRGAFVLYDTKNAFNPSQWKRIGKPKLFQEFLIDILSNFPSLSLNQREQLKNIINQETFLRELIHQFFPNQKESKSLESLPFTPWICRCGHKFQEVIKVESEYKIKKPTITIRQEETQSLLNQLKLVVQKEYSSFSYIPVNIPSVHSFCLFYPNENLDDEELIQKGPEIAKRVQLQKWNPEWNQKFKKFLIHLFPKDTIDAMIKSFEEQPLLEVRKTILSNHPENRNQHSSVIDSFLYSFLPQEIKTEIIQLAIPIADSNWEEHHEAILFCAGFNPFSQHIEFLQVTEARQKLQFLNQEEWVSENSWEIYLQEYL